MAMGGEQQFSKWRRCGKIGSLLPNGRHPISPTARHTERQRNKLNKTQLTLDHRLLPLAALPGGDAVLLEALLALAGALLLGLGDGLGGGLLGDAFLVGHGVGWFGRYLCLVLTGACEAEAALAPGVLWRRLTRAREGRLVRIGRFPRFNGFYDQQKHSLSEIIGNSNNICFL
jgi:hypothetical protein